MRIVSSMTIAQPTPSLVLCRMVAALLRAVRVSAASRKTSSPMSAT
jgi:hypothetical protein